MATEPGTRSSKRPILFGLIGIAALGAAIWGLKTWSYSRAHESTDDAQVDGHIVPVLAKVGGYVTGVSVVENQHVNEGQVLVTIDDAEYRVRMQQAQADLLAAQSAAGTNGSAGQAQAQVQSAAGNEAALSANVSAARAASVQAQADLARMRDLAAKQIVSRQQLDAAQAAADAARARLVAAQEQASAAGAQVTNAQAGVRVAQARTAAAQAALNNAQLQLSYTKITAPASGLVSRKSVEVGQLVAAGQPVMSVVADTGIWVTANFKETQLNDIKVGQPVEFGVDAYGGCTAEGRVQSVSGATGAKFALLPPDNSTGNFTKVVQRVPIRIAVTRACGGRQLRPGMSVDVHIRTG